MSDEPKLHPDFVKVRDAMLARAASEFFGDRRTQREDEMTEMDADWWKLGGPQASELMEKIEPHFRGYSRLVIAIALSRSIAAMLAPTNDESREAFLRRFPTYMRSMWKMMDAVIPRSEQ